MSVTPQSVPKSVALATQSSTWRWTMIAILNLGVCIAYFDRANLTIALNDDGFKNFFQLSNQDRGLLNSAFFWSYAFLQIPAGWVVDRYGVKYPYAFSFLVWSLMSAGTVLASSVMQLFALRFLLGMGESIVTPASMRWIRYHFPEKQRGLAVGVYMTGTKIGPALGAYIATILTAAYGWQTMFLILGLGGLLWLLPWMLMAKDDDRQLEKEAAQKPGAATNVSFAGLMASPVIWGTIIGTFCYMYFVYFCMTWLPAYLKDYRKLSFESSGIYTALSFGGMSAVAVFGGWLADRMIARGGDPVRIRKAFTIAGFVVASTQVIGAVSDSLNVSLFFSVFSLSGLGLATANYWALTQTLIPGGAIGKIVGIQNCAANIPGIVAPILTGWLVHKTGSFEGPMFAIGFFLLLGIASYVFLVREKYVPKS